MISEVLQTLGFAWCLDRGFKGVKMIYELYKDRKKKQHMDRLFGYGAQLISEIPDPINGEEAYLKNLKFAEEYFMLIEKEENENSHQLKFLLRQLQLETQSYIGKLTSGNIVSSVGIVSLINKSKKFII